MMPRKDSIWGPVSVSLRNKFPFHVKVNGPCIDVKKTNFSCFGTGIQFASRTKGKSPRSGPTRKTTTISVSRSFPTQTSERLAYLDIGTPLKPLEYHSTMVQQGGSLIPPPQLCRESSLSHSRCNCFQFVTSPINKKMSQLLSATFQPIKKNLKDSTRKKIETKKNKSQKKVFRMSRETQHNGEQLRAPLKPFIIIVL